MTERLAGDEPITESRSEHVKRAHRKFVMVDPDDLRAVLDGGRFDFAADADAAARLRSVLEASQ